MATGSVRLVIALPADSPFAAERTFVVPYERLVHPDLPKAPSCSSETCGQLPDFALVSGSYTMSPCAQTSICGGVGYFLGNPSMGTAQPAETVLPVHAALRMLKDEWDADVEGLPVPSVQATEGTVPFATPGPQGGPSFDYQTYLQAGQYEQTLTPWSPFDAVFAPDIQDVTVIKSVNFPETVDDGFDVTKEQGQAHATLPTFDISRAAGLERWTAYLRDSTTKQVISNVQTLSGKLSAGVVLVTRRGRVRTVDALANATLVVAPPADAPVPTGVFVSTGNSLPRPETYPPLPPPVTVTGTVSGADGSPVGADLVFEGEAFTDITGQPNYTLFEFVGMASARPAKAGAASRFSVQLPQGQYRVDVRPADTASPTTVFDQVDLQAGGAAPAVTKNFILGAMSTVRGSAKVADGRPLEGATVVALPIGCFAPTGVADAATAGEAPALSPWCLPRPAQTITQSDGSFSLALDPGEFALSVRPSDGTRLPWVTYPSFSVAASPPPKPLPPVEVPAPFSAGLTLVDFTGYPVVHAIVRAYWVPPAGSTAAAVELGEAITDANGNYEMYLTLPSQ
jgi:hypothetical protein